MKCLRLINVENHTFYLLHIASKFSALNYGAKHKSTFLDFLPIAHWEFHAKCTFWFKCMYLR